MGKKKILLLIILSMILAGCVNIEKANINIQPEQTKSGQSEQAQKVPIPTGTQPIDNSLISAEQNINEKWSQVENQYQRRADLIPNLVETVKGYAKHETIVFEDITKARSQWTSAKTIDEKMNAAREIDSTLSRLMTVVDNYPQLKASETFVSLQAQLEGTENRVTVARMDYNTVVRDYNEKFKGIYGYKPKPLFNSGD